MIVKLFLAFLYLAIFVSGVNKDVVFVSILISFLAICLGSIYLLRNGTRIGFPKYFPLMICFVLILQIYLFFISNKLNPFYYTTTMSMGLIYWLIFFNLKNGDRILKSLLIRFSLTYSSFYILSKVFNINLIKLAELIFTQDFPTRHYYFGGFWAITIVLLVGLYWKEFKLKQWLIIGLGIVFVAISNARSGYLSLTLGIGYIIVKKTKGVRLDKKIVIPLISLIVGLFMFSSLGRTTLFSRPYYIQSIESFVKYPLGVGMGNFKQISEMYQLKSLTETSFSIYAHNIFLETLSGVGIFSVVFLAFLILLVRDILKEDSKNIVWGAVIISILTNFMLDASYTIPGFIWILFISIGVFQSKKIN